MSTVGSLRSDLKVLETREATAKKERWSKALEKCGFQFAAKGTLEYLRVLAAYKTIDSLPLVGSRPSASD
jgi:hypothetical protein